MGKLVTEVLLLIAMMLSLYPPVELIRLSLSYSATYGFYRELQYELPCIVFSLIFQIWLYVKYFKALTSKSGELE